MNLGSDTLQQIGHALVGRCGHRVTSIIDGQKCIIVGGGHRPSSSQHDNLYVGPVGDQPFRTFVKASALISEVRVIEAVAGDSLQRWARGHSEDKQMVSVRS